MALAWGSGRLTRIAYRILKRSWTNLYGYRSSMVRSSLHVSLTTQVLLLDVDIPSSLPYTQNPPVDAPVGPNVVTQTQEDR